MNYKAQLVKDHMAKQEGFIYRWLISWVSYSGNWWPDFWAAGINPKVYPAIQSYSSGRNIGVVAMDFPGDGIVGSIITTNTGMDRIGQCCFYADINYGGDSLCIQIGDTSNVGVSWNDRISSFKCSDGRLAYIYEDIDYAGITYESTCGEYRADISAISSSWQDAISSIRIYSCDSIFQSTTKGCTFTTEELYEGSVFTYTSNQASLPTGEDNTFASWYCQPGVGAIVFDDINYGGASYTINCAEREQAAGTIPFLNIISSLKIFQCPYCCFYTQANFKGHNFCVSTYVYALTPRFQNIRSYKCSTTAFATWYPETNFLGGGTETDINADVSSTDLTIYSLKITGGTPGNSSEVLPLIAGQYSRRNQQRRNGAFELLEPWQIGVIAFGVVLAAVIVVIIIFVVKRRNTLAETQTSQKEEIQKEEIQTEEIQTEEIQIEEIQTL
jgi:uncharacterized membrane protein